MLKIWSGKILIYLQDNWALTNQISLHREIVALNPKDSYKSLNQYSETLIFGCIRLLTSKEKENLIVALIL